MTDFNFLAKVTLPSTSGLPTDVATTDWVFGASLADDGSYAGLVAADLSVHFFEHVSGPGKVSSRIATTIDRSVDACSVAVYDVTDHLDGSAFGSPSSVGSFTLGAASEATALPEECAVVLSITADTTGIPETQPNPAYPPTLPKFFRPASRYRGRLSLGPWIKGAADETGGHVFVDLDLQTVIVDAASNFLSTFSYEWQVWSRTDAICRPVVGGFLDNAFDTMRSRGTEPNGRTAWS